MFLAGSAKLKAESENIAKISYNFPPGEAVSSSKYRISRPGYWRGAAVRVRDGSGYRPVVKACAV